jgi:hypothetical protein
MAKFTPGDRVAWSHTLGAQHAAGSILREDALPAGTPVGTVLTIANAAETWFSVQFEDASERVLTSEELVRVA